MAEEKTRRGPRVQLVLSLGYDDRPAQEVLVVERDTSYEAFRDMATTLGQFAVEARLSASFTPVLTRGTSHQGGNREA